MLEGTAPTYYHGTSTALGLDYRLQPPTETGVIQEEGRKKNRDRVFFTRDLGSAKIYAGRAVRRFGGFPVVYRVIPIGPVWKHQSQAGTTVYSAIGGFIEVIE